jgi:CheY-like chemotaxis protein/anti-sigma regulatory factor (Ser/Thr protein kinase)
MATILVVDDSLVERRLAGGLLEQRPGLTELEKRTWLKVVDAANGREALAVMERALPDLVLTDLLMPEMDGLELVEQVRSKYPLVPVVLMTNHGSEDIALQALRRGAASYVPKRHLARDLLETVEDVLALAKAAHGHHQLLGCLKRAEAEFVLNNEPTLVTALIAHLRDNLRRLGQWDESELLRVTVALNEALVNAIEHGNLEVSSTLRQQDEKTYQQCVRQRRQQPPYGDRRVHVTTRESPAEAVYVIRDDGPGFDPATLPDPTDPANLEKTTGRGLLLIRNFMDEVRFNERGNEITLLKRRRS